MTGIGEWLKAARGGITQEVVAERAGVSKSYIGLVENNKRTPSIETAIALAAAVNRDKTEALAALAGETPDQKLKIVARSDADNERAALIRYYDELPEECKKDVLALTEALWRRRRAEGRAERLSAKEEGEDRALTEKEAERHAGRIRGRQPRESRKRLRPAS